MIGNLTLKLTKKHSIVSYFVNISKTNVLAGHVEQVQCFKGIGGPILFLLEIILDLI